MSTIEESYLNGNLNNVMDRGRGVKKAHSSAFAAELSGKSTLPGKQQLV
jgi:hypothetical protein